jgi:hypothetical protein
MHTDPKADLKHRLGPPAKDQSLPVEDRAYGHLLSVIADNEFPSFSCAGMVASYII